jgi:hypothetical protein
VAENGEETVKTIEERIKKGMTAISESKVRRPEALIQEVNILQNDCKTKMEGSQTMRILTHGTMKEPDP